MIPELLAPAGSAPAFEAALNAGADAVYLGVPAFNARALARDFRLTEIPALIDFARGRGKRVYPAMNSLVKEEELGRALETLAFLAKAKPDGVILQDWGLLRLARRHFPELPLHASTLMTAHNSAMVRHLAGLGCRRVVLARELSLVEIRRIESQTRSLGVELELFVHGAMCFCYSGLCRFSSLHGGKSSLRGQCVQPCRRRWQWLDGGGAKGGGRGGKSGQPGKNGGRPDRPNRPEAGYLFSMNDLSGLEHLAELAKTGVRSLKIEGRLKPVTYVHNVVRAYRLALDALETPDEPTRAAMMDEARAHLAAALGRRASTGFFLPGAAEGGALITPGLSGNTGQAVAVVKEVDVRKRQGRTVTVRVAMLVKERVRHGDRLRLHEEKSDVRVSLTLRDFRVAGEPRKEARPGETLIFQSADPALCALRPPWRATLFRVDVSERRKERVGPELARMLEARPATPPFSEEAAKERPVASARPSGKAQWWVQTANLGALKQRFPFAVSRWLLTLNARNVEQALSGGPRGRGRDIRVTWVLPPVILEDRLPWIRDNLNRLREAGHRSFQLGHPGQLPLFPPSGGRAGRQAGPMDLELLVGPAANALNRETVLALANMGFAGAQFSPETDRATLKAALSALAAEPKQGRPSCKLGLLVYGRPALFTARAQSPHFTGHHALKSPRDERYVLKPQDRDLASGVTVHAREPFSLLEHGRELAACGLDYLVLDIGGGWPEQEIETLTALWNAASGRGPTPPHLAGNFDGRLA